MDNSIVGKFVKFSNGMSTSDALKTGMGNFFNWVKTGKGRAPTGDLSIDMRAPPSEMPATGGTEQAVVERSATE
jgi:hypothetical protein